MGDPTISNARPTTHHPPPHAGHQVPGVDLSIRVRPRVREARGGAVTRVAELTTQLNKTDSFGPFPLATPTRVTSSSLKKSGFPLPTQVPKPHAPVLPGLFCVDHISVVYRSLPGTQNRSQNRTRTCCQSRQCQTNGRGEGVTPVYGSGRRMHSLRSLATAPTPHPHHTFAPSDRSSRSPGSTGGPTSA